MDTITTRRTVQTRQHYGCFAAGWPLLLPPNLDCALCYQPDVHPQPHRSAVFPGLIEHGGWPLPLFDLQSLAVPHPLSGDSAPESIWVIVWGRGRDALSLKLDSLPVAVSDLQPARFPQTLPSVLRSCVRSSFRDAQQHWLAIDLVKLGQQLSRLASSL
jgi:hypothetical protein